MNPKRKNELLERRISTLQSNLEKMTNENKALRIENQELLDKEAIYRTRLDEIEIIKREYNNNIAEVKAIREQYQQAVDTLQQMKKDYRNKFKQLIARLKSQVKK